MKNELLEKLRKGKIVLGLTNSYPAAGIVEGMCRGWDFVWIDGQHGQHTFDSILAAVRTASSVGVDSLVRVPGHSRDFIGQVADMNPAAIMVPQVNSKCEAQELADALLFPPAGTRSYGGRRIIDTEGRDYPETQKIMLVTQIETVEAVKAADAIASVDGVDCLFFGPDDMKMQFRLPMSTQIHESEELRDAMRVTADAAVRNGKFTAVPAQSPEACRMAVGLGYSMIVGGSDIRFIRTAARSTLDELKGVVEKWR